ncbi:MAG TPA: YkgJ family cysteine cluster protein, partial [Candidatus Methanoperedens sp.]
MEAFNIEKEIRDLESFPDEKYLNIIREVGFVCDRCGKCCTSEFNDHIFLLDDDAQRIIENPGREYLRPAPYFDLCDNLGRFYVMGYALKTKPNGDCIFYTG